jgi:hypothetical protein
MTSYGRSHMASPTVVALQNMTTLHQVQELLGFHKVTEPLGKSASCPDLA